MRLLLVLVLGSVQTLACATHGTAATDAGVDATDPDAHVDATADAAPDADPNACAVFGAPGTCEATTACTTGHTSYPGHCPGTPADIQCCIVTPDPANNPPTPTGYRLMMQSEVTPAMTTWAVMILNDPVTYPMFSTTTMMFGAQLVLARVEWHPPDFQNGVVHRGVTLYVPL